MKIHVYGTLDKQRQHVARAAGPGAKVVFHDKSPSGAMGGEVAVIWVRFTGHALEHRLSRKSKNVTVVHGGLGDLKAAVRRLSSN